LISQRTQIHPDKRESRLPPASLPIFTELTPALGVHPIGACDTTESSVRSLWEKANLNWMWTWMAVYGGSFSVLAAYVVSTITAAAAEEFKIKV
jgi:hypothetical protein